MNHDYTLITNVEGIRRKGSEEMMIYCFAVLLSDIKKDRILAGASIRGFYADPAAPVFQMHLDQAKVWPHKLDYIPPKHDPGWKCYRQYDLTFADGTAFELFTLDPRRQLCVTEYSGDIYKVWADLREQVATFWDKPMMPIVDYMTPSVVLTLPNFYRSRIEEGR